MYNNMNNSIIEDDEFIDVCVEDFDRPDWLSDNNDNDIDPAECLDSLSACTFMPEPVISKPVPLDCRTFTRPRKQTNRPSLDAMLEESENVKKKLNRKLTTTIEPTPAILEKIHELSKNNNRPVSAFCGEMNWEDGRAETLADTEQFESMNYRRRSIPASLCQRLEELKKSNYVPSNLKGSIQNDCEMAKLHLDLNTESVYMSDQTNSFIEINDVFNSLTCTSLLSNDGSFINMNNNGFEGLDNDKTMVKNVINKTFTRDDNDEEEDYNVWESEKYRTIIKEKKTERTSIIDVHNKTFEKMNNSLENKTQFNTYKVLNDHNKSYRSPDDLHNRSFEMNQHNRTYKAVEDQNRTYKAVEDQNKTYKYEDQNKTYKYEDQNRTYIGIEDQNKTYKAVEGQNKTYKAVEGQNKTYKAGGDQNRTYKYEDQNITHKTVEDQNKTYQTEHIKGRPFDIIEENEAVDHNEFNTGFKLNGTYSSNDSISKQSNGSIEADIHQSFVMENVEIDRSYKKRNDKYSSKLFDSCFNKSRPSSGSVDNVNGLDQEQAPPGHLIKNSTPVLGNGKISRLSAKSLSPIPISLAPAPNYEYSDSEFDNDSRTSSNSSLSSRGSRPGNGGTLTRPNFNSAAFKNIKVPQKELKLKPALNTIRSTKPIIKAKMPITKPEPVVARKTSMVPPRTSMLPEPTASRPSSGIPRPASRLRAPQVRTSLLLNKEK